MTSNTCPVCEEEFSAAGSVRDHTWDVHGACHYCGEECEDDQALYTHWLTVHPDELSRVDRKRAESAVDSLTFTDRLSNQGVTAAVGGPTANTPPHWWRSRCWGCWSRPRIRADLLCRCPLRQRDALGETGSWSVQPENSLYEIAP